MTSLTVNSNASSGSLKNSGSEDDIVRVLMDQRKRERILSNRESARRSRMKKRKKMDDFMAERVRLKTENDKILTNIGLTAEHLVSLEAENAVLRAQMVELKQRIHSLEDILNLSSNEAFGLEMEGAYSGTVDSFLPCMVQPIMAAAVADVFQEW